MKSQRLNLCQSFRNSLIEHGYSTVKIVNAVNAALGELDKSGTKQSEKLGDGRLTKTAYKVTETTTIAETYSGNASSIPLRVDVFNSQLAKLEKVAVFENAPLPPVFCEWFDKFAKADKPEVEA